MLLYKNTNLKRFFILALLTIAQNMSLMTKEIEDFEKTFREYLKDFSRLRREYHLDNNKQQNDIFKKFAMTLVACQRNSISSSYCRENEKDILDRFFTHPNEKECAFYEIMQEFQNLKERFHETSFHETRDLAIKKDLLHTFNALLSRFSNLFDKEISEEKIRAIFLDARCLKTFHDHITELYDI